MVRLKKLQRKPIGRANNNRSPKGERKGFTMLNFLACICLLLNVLVLSISLLINRRLKEDALPPAGASLTPKEVDPLKAAATQPALRAAAPVQAAAAPGTTKFHIVITSDCKDPSQDWQAYVFFHHLAKSKQQGEATQIFTGCTPGDFRTQELQQRHQRFFDKMGRTNEGGGGASASRFHIYFAPAHPEQLGVGNLRTHLKYFNRPYGVQHWMENHLKYTGASSSNNANDDTVILMMDSDMVIQKPFTETFQEPQLWKKLLVGPNPPTRVAQGMPLAQHVPFPSNWWQEVSAENTSPEIRAGITALQRMSDAEVDNHYAAGPPFLIAAKEFYPLVQKWNEVSFPLHQALTEKILREPHGAYALAAAILNQPHQLSNTFAVSNYRDPGFGLFQQAYKTDDAGGAPNAGGTGALCRKFPKHLSPHVLQYSKRYAIGNYVIGKHYVHQDFIGKPESCAAPLFAEPPDNVAEMFNYYKDPELQRNVNIDSEQHVHTMTYMVCETIEAFNDAAIHYKQVNCPGGNANVKKTLTF